MWSPVSITCTLASLCSPVGAPASDFSVAASKYCSRSPSEMGSYASTAAPWRAMFAPNNQASSLPAG